MNQSPTRRTRLGERSRRARPLVLAILAAKALGWLSLGLGTLVLLLEVTGVVDLLVRRELTRRLEPLGSVATYDGIKVDWLGPGVTLTGFRVTKGQITHLAGERLYVALAFSPERGLTLGRLGLSGGVLRVRPPLIEDLRGLLELRKQQDQPRLADVRLPSVEVRGFRVEFEGPEGNTHNLGSIDFSLVAKPHRPARIHGRLVLPRRAMAERTPELYLHGVANLSGKLELFASAKDLAIESWHMPEMAPFTEAASMQPAGNVQVQARARFDLVSGVLPEVEWHLDLKRARLWPPWVDAPLNEVDLRLTATFDPTLAEGFTDTAAWSGAGDFSGDWAEQRIQGGLRLGSSARQGNYIESWFHVPGLDVETPQLVALGERSVLIQSLFEALRPAGEIEARFALACREPWHWGQPMLPTLEYSLCVEPHSTLSGAWHGWPLPEFPELIPMAFPLPVTADEGTVLYARNARFARRELLDVDFIVDQHSGPSHVTYQEWSNRIDMPPFASGYGKTEADLVISVPHLALDEKMKACMVGLRQIPELETLFDDYGLTGGRAFVNLHVSARAGIPEPMVEVQVDVTEARAAWQELPVPAQDISGRLLVLDNGRGENSVNFALQAQTESSQGVAIKGRVRHRRPPGAQPGDGQQSLLELDLIEVEVEGLDFAGGDLDILSQALPEVGEALEIFSPTGRGDARLTRVRSAAGHSLETHIEVTPGEDVVLVPEIFPMVSSNIRGRVIVAISEAGQSSATRAAPAEPQITTTIAPLIGRWVGGVPITLNAEFPSQGVSRGQVLSAGLRPTDSNLVDGLARALGSAGERVLSEMGSAQLSGAVDMAYAFELPEEGGDVTGDYIFHLRDNALGSGAAEALELQHLAGELYIAESELRSGKVSGVLNGTPVTLLDLQLARGEGGPVMQADLQAMAISLDRQLLAQLLDEQTLTTLVDEFGLRGKVDIESARLSLKSAPRGGIELALSGEASLSDVFAKIGLPLSILSARLDLEELILSGGEVRGWGRVYDLYGLALDRDISQTSLLLSYYNSRLSLDTLEGSFCKGRIHGLGNPGDGSGAGPPVFSVDLQEPFEFQTNLALDDLDLGVLLDGVFSSDIANEGLASGEVRLRGRLANLLSVTGLGWGEVRDSVLWSVPVLRSLFSQLGYDATAIFDSMRTDFHVADGLIFMEHMQVHSPILNLYGHGTLGLDGALHHELQVKYSLADKAGPLGSLIHFLQNTLLSVAIRGDMARPMVFLRGALTGPFRGVDDDWHALPLPGLSPLPARF